MLTAASAGTVLGLLALHPMQEWHKKRRGHSRREHMEPVSSLGDDSIPFGTGAHSYFPFGHKNVWELTVVFMAFKHFWPILEDEHVKVQIDSTSAARSAAAHLGSSSPEPQSHAHGLACSIRRQPKSLPQGNRDCTQGWSNRSGADFAKPMQICLPQKG